MLFGHYFMQASNWALFIIPCIAIYKRLKLVALISAAVAVFSNLYHYSYNEDATYHYLLGGLTCTTIVEITATTLQACENLLIWNMPNFLKYAFLICDYSSSNLGFITFLVFLMPKRKTNTMTGVIFFGWLIWVGAAGLTRILEYNGLFPTNSIYITPIVTAYLLLAFFYHLFEYNHVPVKDKESILLYYSKNFNVWMMLLGIGFMLVGAFVWIVVQNVWGFYFITHPIWHLCTVASASLLLLSIKPDSVFYQAHDPATQ